MPYLTLLPACGEKVREARMRGRPQRGRPLPEWDRSPLQTSARVDATAPQPAFGHLLPARGEKA